jgi:hypothetical protein
MVSLPKRKNKDEPVSHSRLNKHFSLNKIQYTDAGMQQNYRKILLLTIRSIFENLVGLKLEKAE